MKTTFNISPKFPVASQLAKEITRFCVRQALNESKHNKFPAPKEIRFKMFGSKRTTRSGRADRNGKHRFPWFKPNVFVRLGKGYGVHSERYHRYADSPLCTCDGVLETCVHLVAHELGHAICGFHVDKTGEFQCERFAARCLEAWRLNSQDPACMI